jgi:hypothetical protein
MSDPAPITSSWATIKREAHREGCVVNDFDDLAAYNKHRLHRGMAPFAVGLTGNRCSSGRFSLGRFDEIEWVRP